METDKKFDLNKFRDRCVNEFCELTEKPTQILYYHKASKIKHFAPGLTVEQRTAWRSAQRQVLKQTDFAAPFIFQKDTAYGIIDLHRPLMVIKFGDEVYWRAVPKRYAEACAQIAKQRKLYAKVRTIPLPKSVKVKQETVESFIERVRLETLNPPRECGKSYKGTMVLSDGSVLNSNNYWHPSAHYGIGVLNELHENDIDPTPYYQMFAHVQPQVTEGWVIIDEPGVGSFIEYRINRTFYQKIVPEFLREQINAYAKRLSRFYRSPSYLLSGGNIIYLKK